MEKIPFYMAYPMQNMFLEEAEYQRDIQRLKNQYPKEVQRIQRYVEEECNGLDYAGSMMYDEYPDQVMMRLICNRIYQKIENIQPLNEHTKQLVEVLLCNEMYQRKCHQRKYRRYW